MSGNLLSYSGITTKVKAMKSNLITDHDYNAIANLDSVTDFITFLKKHPSYFSLFTNLDEHILHRGQIERIIMNAVYKDYAKIYLFASQHQRNALQLIFFRYEVNVLKGCLQRVFNQDNIYDLDSFKEFFRHHSKLNVDALASSKSIEEFITHLKGTKYQDLLNTLYHSNHKTLFDYEMQLDIYYFMRVWKLKNKCLKGEELNSFTNCIGIQIDLLNIMWIYRSKKFYTLDASKILSVIIPIQYKLKKEQLTKLMEVNTFEEFLTGLNSTYYHTLCDSITNDDLELMYRKAMMKVYISNSTKYPSSILPILCHLFLKEQEIDKLTTALECIRYNLDPNVILHYVI